VKAVLARRGFPDLASLLLQDALELAELFFFELDFFPDPEFDEPLFD
jgi:hypothetical protein